MKKFIVFVGLCVIATGATVNASVTVFGTSCVYFAGQTGTVSGGSSYFDIDRADAATLPAYVDISGLGSTICITAAGLWDHTPFASTVGSGPDGKASFFTTDSDYDDLGISLMQGAPVNSLLGVFLTNSGPSGSAPTGLVYGDDMTSPLLQQTFRIGASLANINVPTGATRLFFGLNNGWEWTNNSGFVDVTVSACPVPAPGAILLGSMGAGLVGWLRRRQSL